MTETSTTTQRLRTGFAVFAILVASGLLILELLTDVQWMAFAGQVVAAFLGGGQ